MRPGGVQYIDRPGGYDYLARLCPQEMCNSGRAAGV
jgi:hypothetical protein